MDTEEDFIDAEILSSEDEREDVDDENKKHKLIDSVRVLNKREPIYNKRTIRSSEFSEFNFITNEDCRTVHLSELIRSVEDKKLRFRLRKRLKNVQKKKIRLDPPLPKVEKEKLERSLAYEKTSSELEKWTPVVIKNRKADQILFPLEKLDLKVFSTENFIKRFQPRTPLEMEVEALLRGSDHVQPGRKVLTPAEEKALRAMDLEEAKERWAELKKYKALLSYREKKARWQNKIKSKSYHRHLKRERLSAEKKKLDEMEKNDPEAFMAKMEKLEKDHIKERTTLKHRGGSKFQRKQMMYAKYDPESRMKTQDMLEKSRRLTQKHVQNDSDSSDSMESQDEEENSQPTVSSGDNPWMAPPSVTRISVNNTRPLFQVGQLEQRKDDSSSDEIGFCPDEKPDKQMVVEQLKTGESDKKDAFVDPANVFSAGTAINQFQDPVQIAKDDEADNDLQRITIAEAFADDDVIAEFSQEKMQIVEEQKSKDIDLNIPGWGCWGGSGLSIPKKKRERFIIQAPEGPPRRDHKLGNVIINEEKDKTISKYQMKKVPFPFTSTHQVEQCLRAPLGKNWNPETAFKQLVKPKIRTRIGAIISPIDKSESFKSNSQTTSGYRVQRWNHTRKKKIQQEWKSSQ